MPNRIFTRSMMALVCLCGPGIHAEDPAPAPGQQAPTPQPAAKDDTFKLGEVTVVVSAKREALDTVNTKVDAERIATFNQDTVGTALAVLPGVNMTVNARNEQMLYVRGNDSRQVPVFLDGIPVYVPYDGEMDYGRFTTFDLSEIQVAKGFSSVLYGPNTLGGAINLVTKRPTEAFQGDAVAGLAQGNGQKAAVNIGMKRDLFYVQMGGSYDSSDHWRMSSNYAPTSHEDGGWRDNSYTKDKKFAIKAGFTPNASDEYVVGFQNQEGDKGNPVNTSPQISPYYWQWPTWNKQSAYFSSTTAVGDASDVKLRAYYDTYVNTIYAYTDGNYDVINTTGNLKPTGQSFYKDFTHGAMAEFETRLIPANSLRAVFQTKDDVHREASVQNATPGWTHYQDHYLSAGLEDNIDLAPAWDLSLGAGWDQQRPVSSGAWELPAPKSFYHGQAGLFWKVAPGTQVYASLAQKEHFATLKDRYSLRMGTYIDNPGLVPERSINYETGVKTAVNAWLKVEAALFLSDIHDLIQGMPVAGGMMQMQNVGEVRNSGVELSAEAKPTERVQLGLGYTYLDRSNITNPSVTLTGTPRNNANAYVKVQVLEQLHVLASMQSQDALWDSYSNLAKQSVVDRLGGFTTFNLNLGWKPLASLEVDGGFSNLFDRNYQLTTGYPLPGRMWFSNARYRF